MNLKVTKRMKTHFILLLLLSTLISSSCCQTKSSNSDSFAKSQIEEDLLITNLELLGKIWGFLKYHHPEVGKGKYDWDDELFQFLPEYMNANDAGQRDESLLRWIEKYGELSVCTTCKETVADTYQKPDFSWIENGNMSAVLKEKIKEIYRNRHQGEHYYVKKAYDAGNPEFLNEQPYPTSFPDKNLRLLALYRYWNIIQYFFPYKYLTDKDWDEVLREYIPKFINAKTALEYQLTLLQLTGEINDTHARHFFQGANEIDSLIRIRYAPFRTNEIDSLRGTMYAPFRVRFIENELTVTDYFKPELKETAGLETGDFITHINGKKIEYIIDSIKSYYPASNETARMYYIAPDLVRSNNHSIHIVYNSSGTIKQKELTLYKRFDLDMNKKSNKLSYDSIMVDDSMFIGYITLETIKGTEISHIKKSFMNAKGIIIDIRNYPATPAPFSLGDYFTSKRKPFARFTTGNINNPGEFYFSRNVSFLDNNAGNRYSSNVFETPGSENYFPGKLVVIVNEATISSAEYHAMAFRAGDNTMIIGSQTQGADGNISFFPLPGGLKTGISGIGVYYPDGRGTQRIGIVPDIEVKPTIQGIREGRDELLEKAIEIIKNEGASNNTFFLF